MRWQSYQPSFAAHPLPNTFGKSTCTTGHEYRTMPETDDLLAKTGAPTDRQHETLDARELPPPQPLRNTLELLGELDDETVLVQLNDRAPQHLYPRLADRGYVYDTVENEDLVLTAIWRAD